MKNRKESLVDNSLYSIEKLDQLAIIKFKSDAPIEELYKLENSNTYFKEDLDKLEGKGINTRLIIFSKDIFSENRFQEFFSSIKKDSNEKIDFSLLESNIHHLEFSRFINIKYRFIQDVLNSNKLTVFALNGSSVGLWLSTILSGNFCILSQNSEFTFEFLKDDIYPLGGLIYYFDKYVNKAVLDEILLLRNSISADQLLNWGLINRIFSQDSFESESIELAKEIANNSTFYINSIIEYKHRLNSVLRESLDYERAFYTNRGLG